jgi:hypothetical protein
MENDVEKWTINVPHELRDRYCELAKAAGTTGAELIRLHMSKVVLQGTQEEGEDHASTDME